MQQLFKSTEKKVNTLPPPKAQQPYHKKKTFDQDTK